MYVLEVVENGKKGRNKNSNFKSFEDFEFLLRKKDEEEKVGNKCLVYKIENNGKEVMRLSDKKMYKIVTDFDKEIRKCWKQYVSIMDMLVKCEIRDFYIGRSENSLNNILYILDNNNGNNIEVEMVRKTPRYEVKYNGVMMSDSETSQADIIDKMFNNKKSGLRKCWRKKDILIRYN